MRTFKTKANRNDDTGKIDYAHLSPITERLKAEYMHQHRTLENGERREPDNWKHGMPPQVYRKSFLGHCQDLKILIDGGVVLEDGHELTPFDATMGVLFNLEALVHTLMQDQPLERKYTNGDLEARFNNLFTKNVQRHGRTRRNKKT